MKPQLSKMKVQLLDYIKEQPGQTAVDYQALMDALADQMGHKGRILKVDSAVSYLYKQGYVSREGRGGFSDPYKFFATKGDPKAPKEYKVPTARRVNGATMEVLYTIVVGEGKELALSHGEAKAVYDVLKTVFN